LIPGGIPAYLHISGIIRERITKKEYQIQIPPENVLSNEFRVSRVTIRQALEVLKREGVLYSTKGVGTLISDKKDAKYGMITGSLDDFLFYASESTIRMLENKTIPADEEMSDKLKISPGEKLRWFKFIRHLKNQPIALVNVYVPYNLGIRISLGEIKVKAIFQLIEEKCHVPVLSTVQRIRAVSANSELTKVLKVQEGEPVLLATGTYYTSNGLPVELSIIYYDAKEFEYTIRLQRQSAK
jgi:GntR family transcriptional regulator